MSTEDLDLMCASEVEEFFYKHKDTAVPEGDPIGVDADYGDEVRLILFNNIYWSPRNEEAEE